MQQRRCGNSGLRLSAITLGLMVRDCSPGAPFESVRRTVLRAVELGVTSIDLATGYGGGALEQAVGRVLADDLAPQRDRLVLATKAGWADGSRKTLVRSLERSLRQLRTDYVDLYYHHAPDAETPIEETVAAVDLLVRQGKTLYVGISNYSPAETARMVPLFRQAGTPCVIHQFNYNLLNRWVEDGLLELLRGLGMGGAVFSSLAQGLLSGNAPEAASGGASAPRPASRAAGTLDALVEGVATGERAYGRYPAGDVRAHVATVLARLREIARRRAQTLAQLAIAWVLRHPVTATALVGMSSVEQLEENVAALDRPEFSAEELAQIAEVLPPRWGMA